MTLIALLCVCLHAFGPVLSMLSDQSIRRVSFLLRAAFNSNTKPRWLCGLCSFVPNSLQYFTNDQLWKLLCGHPVIVWGIKDRFDLNKHPQLQRRVGKMPLCRNWRKARHVRSIRGSHGNNIAAHLYRAEGPAEMHILSPPLNLLGYNSRTLCWFPHLTVTNKKMKLQRDEATLDHKKWQLTN